MPRLRTIPTGVVAVAALLVTAFLTVPTSAPEAFDTSSLQCTKTADPTNIVLPSTNTLVTHTIEVNVRGSKTLTDVTIQDALGTNVAFVATGTDPRCNPPIGGVVTCNLGTLTGGAMDSVDIVVDLAAVTADQVTNVATVSSPDTSRGGSCQDDVTITRIVEEPLLACLGKNVTDPSNGVLDEGVTKIVTYKISIQNQGDATATNVEVSDLFTVEQAIEFVSASSDNGGPNPAECFIDSSATAASDGDAIMNSSDVVCDIGDIGTGVTRMLTLMVRIVDPTAGQTFSNDAVADADNTDPTTQTCQETLTVQSTPGGDEGCTPGYWKNDADKRGAEHWTGYEPDDGLSVVNGSACLPDAVFDPNFNGAGDPSWWTCNLDGNKGDTETDDLLNALAFPGDCGPTDRCDRPGAARILLRAAVAALLNAASPDVNYPRSVSDIITDTEDAIASKNRNVMLGLARGLDIDNNLGCPLPAFQ